MLVAPSVAIPPPRRLLLLKAVCAHFNILEEAPISNLNEIKHYSMIIARAIFLTRRQMKIGNIAVAMLV
jgi:hypothetical protein